MVETLMLGDTDIGAYVDRMLEPSEDQTSKIDSHLARFGKYPEFEGALACEKVPALVLYHQRVASQYPQIDPSFLSMHSTIKIPWSYEIQAPRFSVYPLDKRNRFSVRFRGLLFNGLFENDESYFREGINFVARVNADIGVSDEVRDVPSISPVLLRPLVGGFEFGKSPFNLRDPWYFQTEGRFRRVPLKVRMKYSDLQITSEFNGAIPKETRKRVREAESLIPEENMFLISETKPKDWAVEEIPEPVISVDPLVVGVIDNRVYLIDHFDTTPLEEMARREFLS